MVFVVGVVGLAVFGLWRARRATSPESESPTGWITEDTRNKRLFRNFDDLPTDDWLVTGNQPIPRISREEGHGKDGGV